MNASLTIEQLVNLLFAVCGIVGSSVGIGQQLHVLVERHTVETAMFWWWLGQTSYIWVSAIAKISIVLALLRFTVSRLYRIILWVVITGTSIISIAFWGLMTLQCQPVSFFWRRVDLYMHPGSIEGKCVDLNSVVSIGYLYSVAAFIGDLTLGILPVFLVWNLQMSLRSKAGLIAILSIGCIAGAAVVIRMPYIHDYRSHDFLYATANISIWSNIEAGLGITAGSLVTLRPLFRWLRDPELVNPRQRHSSSWPVPTGVSPRCSNLSAPQTWRTDFVPELTPTMVTTIHATRHQRWSSSQEHFYHKRDSVFEGLNVEKTFYISEDDP
ncbi:hypothetical protein N7468_009393 [Penicillium chermesinum]|uniref:Rhodopsin domain-containing protein n=1 Tax=Penicillium chermesinum TaxID=63820 RepID=A0A9W9TF77_9EURO|nr:uncharacterized protein N7468_009393 [Penicillium chermesinum]KAJ5220189.1 hypothetical protein N7468_009393 [Penicillium chermesinum]KAJ6157633.1 hypothetical protein N7470_005225 [Penicillium chermesinum]